MTLRRILFSLLVCGMIGLVSMGCGGAPTPTPTVIPPTAVPPTVPIPKPTQGLTNASGETLLDALNRVKESKSYRVNVSITGKGNFVDAGGPTPVPGAENEPITLVQMRGEVNGNDAHFTMQGMLTAFLGIESDKTFEVISHNGIAYLKGPVPLLNAMEEKWYQAPPQAAGMAQPPLSPRAFLDSFGENGINLAAFKNSATETLDGKKCAVYAGDKAAVIDALGKVGGAAGATRQELDSIDNAQFKFWVCEDGYLHQVQMLIEGHDKADPTQKGSFEINMHLQDFDTDIQITPPSETIPLQLPEQVKPEGTPTP